MISVPSAAARATRSAGAAPPRLISTTRPAPRPASHSASWTPIPPVPPVTSVVPVGRHAVSAGSAVRTSRRTDRPFARTAIWSSGPAPARARANSGAVEESRTAGRSTRPPQRPGCSRAATRPSPQATCWAGAVTGSSAPVVTAPRVAHQSGAVPSSARTRSRVLATPRGRNGWSGCGRSSRASRDSTPVAPARASRSAAVVVTAPGPTASRTAASTAASRSGGVTTTQRPSSGASSRIASGTQDTE